MKKFIYLLILINSVRLINFAIPAVYATSSTPSAAQDLLDRVATKVATLTSKLRRVFTGKVKSVGTTSYIVTTSDGDKTVTTNDVTSFFKIRAGSRSEINFSAIKTGDDIAAIGTVDPNTFEMTAKQVISKVRRYNIVGTITAVDKTIYSVQEIGGSVTKLDFSDAITLQSLDQVGKFTTAKLANFKSGDVVFAIAYISDPKSDILSPLKVLLLEK